MTLVGKDPIGRPAASIFDSRDFLRLLGNPKTGRPPIVWAAEIVFAALFAWCLGLLLASFMKPMPETQLVVQPSAANSQPDGLSPDNVNPFRTASISAEPDHSGAPTQNLAETTLDLVLYGTWVDPDGGTAFIGTGDDEQKRYSVGDKIVSGATLRQVYRDQVTLSRGGISEVLKIRNWQSVGGQLNTGVTAPPTQATAPALIEGGAAVNSSFNDIVRISAQTSPDDGMRFALKPAGDLAAFEALGLEEGDILISIDEFDIASAPASVGPAIRQLRGKSETTVVVDRDGVETPVLILIPTTGGPGDDEKVTYEN